MKEHETWALQREIERRVLQVAVGVSCRDIKAEGYSIREVRTREGDGYYVGLAKVIMGMNGVRFEGRKHWLRVWISAAQYDYAKSLYERHTGRCFICRGEGCILGHECKRCAGSGVAPVHHVDPALANPLAGGKS